MANWIDKLKAPELRWGLFIFVSLAAILYVVGRSPKHRVKNQIGLAAPPLEFELAGKRTDLASYKGKVVLLNFWASWCTPCMEEMPALRELEERCAKKGLELLLINVSGEPPTILDELPKAALPTQRIHRFNDEQADAYQIETIPHSVLVDREGTIREIYIGPRDWTSTAIIDEIEKLL